MGDYVRIYPDTPLPPLPELHETPVTAPSNAGFWARLKGLFR